MPREAPEEGQPQSLQEQARLQNSALGTRTAPLGEAASQEGLKCWPRVWAGVEHRRCNRHSF